MYTKLKLKFKKGMKMEETLNRQISDQIEGKTTIEVIFPNTNPDFLSLYAQDDEFFIEPACCASKKITKNIYKELCDQFTDEQIFNTNPKVIRTKLSYDEFYDMYYNKF